ncbi:MAG: hypothetical protein KBD78_09695 [Oligoflexales bacterium]|nr:hypothetical protein [Oligoflexales bacterium]
MTEIHTAQQKVVCPDWAQEQLLKLRAIEINLGNIPDQQDFIAKDMRQLMNSLLQHDDVHAADSDFADLLFAKVAFALASDGYSHEQIANFVNARVGYKGGPPYCNVAEVAEAIQNYKIN